MDLPPDPGLSAVLAKFGVGTGDLLGHGGEASVYAFGKDRILRVLHAGGRAEDIRRRRHLIDELSRARPPFALPDIVDVGELAGRVFTIERRLPGRSVMEALPTSTGAGRRQLVEGCLETAAALGDLTLKRHHGFGDLMSDNPITTSTWRSYLVERAAANLARSTPDFWSIDPESLADGLPETSGPAFVHLDAFAGNMLTDGNRITAVIDIGPSSVAGDRRLDPLSVAVYLGAPEITPVADSGDVDAARSWLRAAGLDQWFEPARRWLAAFWSYAVDDPAVLGWCRSVLLDSHRTR